MFGRDQAQVQGQALPSSWQAISTTWYNCTSTLEVVQKLDYLTLQVLLLLLLLLHCYITMVFSQTMEMEMELDFLGCDPLFCGLCQVLCSKLEHDFSITVTVTNCHSSVTTLSDCHTSHLDIGI